MGVLQQPDGNSNSQDISPRFDRIRLYEQYGAMAYGIILQIIPDPNLAQQALVSLFASPQIEQCLASPSNSPACAIIRLARAKALDVNRVSSSAIGAVFPEQSQVEDGNMGKYIFDLSFNQGYELPAIAERLKISYVDAMKSMRDYFKYLRRP